MQPAKRHFMDQTKQVVSITELKILLTAIIDNDRSICVRFRLVGELWQTRFMRVLARRDDFVMLHDEVLNKAIAIKLPDVMQFEIDGSIYGYKPNDHYNVTPFQ
jgi:hypothetical protein